MIKTVYIVQEQYDYDSSPAILGVYSNKYDALTYVSYQELMCKYSKYEITECDIIEASTESIGKNTNIDRIPLNDLPNKIKKEIQDNLNNIEEENLKDEKIQLNKKKKCYKFDS